MNKRKIITLALAVMMIAILAVGGSLAFLTDTDNAKNVFTVGNVQIVQNETDRNGDPYVTKQHITPNANDTTDATGLHTGVNYVDKFVTVTNTGTEPAYVRTYLAIPAALDDGPTTFDASKNILHWNATDAEWNKTLGGNNDPALNSWYWGKSFNVAWPDNGGDWNGYVTDIDGVLYNVYVATHKAVLEAGVTTQPSLFGVALDSKVDYIVGTGYVLREGNTVTPIDFDLSKEFDVLVLSEATQSAGFADAFDALNQAFGVVGTYCPFGGTVVATFTNN